MKEALSVLCLALLVSVSEAAVTKPGIGEFLGCLRSWPSPESPITDDIFTADNTTTFLSFYLAYTKNTRFASPNYQTLMAIVTAKNLSHIQATVVCAKSNGVQIRIRSGGHDYEGLSYISSVPFVILDLFNLRSITVDVPSKQAWVQAGATLGELYTKISEAGETVNKTLEQGGIDVLYKWQLVSSKLPESLYVKAMSQVANGTRSGERTIAVLFYAQFLGGADELVSIMNQSLPELGLKSQDCLEMSWLNSTLFWEDLPVGTPASILLDRPSKPEKFFKSKSDYVKKPIPKEGIEKLWNGMLKINNNTVYMHWNPYGGVMDTIPATATPFPHREGNLFKIQYYTAWFDANATKGSLDMMKELYEVAEPYVSSNPREAFLNYRDIDIGSNPSGETTVDEAEIYGSKYFVGNLKRLMEVKAKYDPENFFKNEQSIPPARVKQ
ncbi:hypothetical protein IGI04_032064 [Brassica rapa subsp. trilocularis]|uniref:FAD-binding PCMH-type domain-containing protein n=1 Tax=Brassica rapa subsp. trilocularis TaxID=1813537 RepID=A0ABQ7LXX2_BRACM|nr:hypothetical protein IGI04_032064 [Brassica rapa subsp. trilocularis]